MTDNLVLLLPALLALAAKLIDYLRDVWDTTHAKIAAKPI